MLDVAIERETMMLAGTTQLILDSPAELMDARLALNNHPDGAYSANYNYSTYKRISMMAWTYSGQTMFNRNVMRFVLDEIPTGSQIVSAILYLYSDPTITSPSSSDGNSQLSGTNEFYIERIIEPWDVLTVTWNNQPASTMENRLLIPPSTSVTENIQIDLTGMVQTWANTPSGISVISRSPNTYYHDGIVKGINLDMADRFSLDGQRLICTSGNYGGNGSQYRTENDMISKVTCYTGTYGPDRFEVKTKDGLTCQYGFVSNADQTIDGHNETVSWYVNKITDVYGNYINFSYIKDGGFNYISNISYGDNYVHFYYVERSDKKTFYLKGGALEQRLILEKIGIRYQSGITKRYEFKYNYPIANYNGYSLLNEVIEYGLESGNSRMNSTVFNYQTPDAVSFTQTEYNNTHNFISYKSRLTPGDFNGDGLEDVFTVDNPDVSGSYTGWKLFLNNGNDSFSSALSGDFGPDENKLSFTAVDLNVSAPANPSFIA